MGLRALASLIPAEMDGPLSPGARRVKVGQGRFGWWVGVLTRTVRPFWDIWHCDHHHGSAKEARECVSDLVQALQWQKEPVRLRND